MADSCWIAELKETIEKMNAELIQSHTKISELNAEVREQEECLSAAQKEMRKLQEENAQLPRDLREVSSGSVVTMADSCCIAELKETIEKMNAELIQSHTKISELNAEVREQEECLRIAQKELRKLQEENAQLPRDLKEVNETNDDALDINSFPNEIILKIFSYLTQNQLGQIARVCGKWNVLTKSPVLWRKVNVKIFSSDRKKNSVAKSFINGLPSCVTFIRLDFSKCRRSIAVDFEELCVKLHQNCPRVEELILIYLGMSNILPEIINFCTQFLQCVKKLVFYECAFYNNSATVELNDNSKIEVLDLFSCDISHFSKTQFSKLLYLKELRLAVTHVDDTWFVNDTSFFNRLHVLNLGSTSITASTFLAIQRHGHNLKELYLCRVDLIARDLTFNKSVFPHLRKICLRGTFVTCEDVVSLIQSCPSLENVYVTERVAESCAAHPFDVANRCKSGIVKAIDWGHNHNVDYSHN